MPGAKQELWADFSHSYCVSVCRSRERESHEGRPRAHLPSLARSPERHGGDAAPPWLCTSRRPPSPEAAAAEEDSGGGAVVPLFTGAHGGDPKVLNEHFSCNFMDSKEA